MEVTAADGVLSGLAGRGATQKQMLSAAKQRGAKRLGSSLSLSASPAVLLASESAGRHIAQQLLNASHLLQSLVAGIQRTESDVLEGAADLHQKAAA